MADSDSARRARSNDIYNIDIRRGATKMLSNAASASLNLGVVEKFQELDSVVPWEKIIVNL